jgi:uncharacterized cupredoxin-like copper-binding protein
MTARRISRLFLASALLLVPVGVGACGDEADTAVDEVTSAVDEGIDSATSGVDDGIDSATDGTDSGDAQVLEVPAAEQGLAYATTSVSAPAGTITLRMPNPSTIPHNIAIEKPEAVTGEVVNENGVSEVTADFAAGEYEFFCTVPGHREAGMKGTLTVN